MELPPLSKSKTPNGQKKSIKESVVSNAHKAIAIEQFTECKDNSESKEDPSKNHDSTCGCITKSIKDEDWKQQHGILMQYTIDMNNTGGNRGCRWIPKLAFMLGCYRFRILRCCLVIIRVICHQCMAYDIHESPKDPLCEEGNPGSANVVIGDKGVQVLVHDAWRIGEMGCSCY